jgi:membrane protein implicated in regulation of membrane protease activity
MQQTVTYTDFIFDIAIRGVLVRLANLAGGASLSGQIMIVMVIVALGIVVLQIFRFHETILGWFFGKPEVIEPTPLLFNEDLNPVTAQVLVGREGVVQAPLRPLGNVQLDGRTYVVKSEGQYVEPGTPVRVDRIEGPHIIVVPVTEEG